jgi:hypothetical protein
MTVFSAAGAPVTSHHRGPPTFRYNLLQPMLCWQQLFPSALFLLWTNHIAQINILHTTATDLDAPYVVHLINILKNPLNLK